MIPEPEAAPSHASEDLLLLARVAKQDRQAFEMLYRRCYRRVFHFVSRLVRQEAAAEEVVSDVMLAVWQGAPSFEGSSRVSTWMLGIAYRQAMKLIEKNRKHSVVDSDDELLGLAVDVSPAANPESVAMTDSYAALLQKGMDALTEPHRVVVELTAMGHAYGEIAEIVGCPENTVKTRMFHARVQLKRFLDNAGHTFGTSHRTHRAATPAARCVADEPSVSRTEYISIERASRRSGYRI